MKRLKLLIVGHLLVTAARESAETYSGIQAMRVPFFLGPEHLTDVRQFAFHA
jgi:hypothetical protein